ncbi:MAG: class I SAM-dependent methyltransferase [Paracoccaceae bacterium]
MEQAKFWDKAASKYANDPIKNMADYAATLQRMKDILRPDHTVLELGCGTGSTALELAGGVARYLGTDVSPAMIEIAQDKARGAAISGLSFQVGAAFDVPTGYDVIIALNMLHLLEDLEVTLARIHAALPPGGLLISKTSLLKDGLWVLPWIIPVMRAIGKAPFVRALGQDVLFGMIKDAGFEITETIVQADTAPRAFVVARKV